MKKRVDVEYTVEALKEVAVKAALLGISRRKYLEYATYTALHNSTNVVKLSVEEYLVKFGQNK